MKVKMSSKEIRDLAVARLVERGMSLAQAMRMSNKDVAKAFGLIPEGWAGIGAARGRKLIAAFLLGSEPPSVESLGGYKRTEAAPKQALQPAFIARPAKKKTFYDSREWRELRYKALVLHGNACQCCGASRSSGAIMHVDHVKPRSKFPELELVLENLQVLCEACNLGKSNKDDTDWRPSTEPEPLEEEARAHLGSMH